jgi:addiction module HigA family antidote
MTAEAMKGERIVSGLKPMHPGELLRDVVLPDLKEKGVPRTAVADALGVSRRTLYAILEEKVPVTPEMAFKLCAVLGQSPEFWATLQLNYDLAIARKVFAAQPAPPRLYEAEAA